MPAAALRRLRVRPGDLPARRWCEISTGDPGTGWCLTLGSSHAWLVASHFPEEAQAEMFGAGRRLPLPAPGRADRRGGPGRRWLPGQRALAVRVRRAVRDLGVRRRDSSPPTAGEPATSSPCPRRDRRCSTTGAAAGCSG